MKAISKILSLALVGVMTLGCATTAFAAEPKADATTEVVSEADNNEFTIVEQEVPVVVESNDEGIVPMKQGDEITFPLGSVGYMSNCGFTPKFKCWVTGGSADTKVMFEFVTGGSQKYGHFGPVNGNGSNYLDKPFVVFNSTGAWQFKAYVSSGPNNGNLVCHVQQYY